MITEIKLRSVIDDWLAWVKGHMESHGIMLFGSLLVYCSSRPTLLWYFMVLRSSMNHVCCLLYVACCLFTVSPTLSIITYHWSRIIPHPSTPSVWPHLPPSSHLSYSTTLYPPIYPRIPPYTDKLSEFHRCFVRLFVCSLMEGRAADLFA